MLNTQEGGQKGKNELNGHSGQSSLEYHGPVVSLLLGLSHWRGNAKISGAGCCLEANLRNPDLGSVREPSLGTCGI